MEKRTVKLGLGVLPKPLTAQQARRLGDKLMPSDLKKTGFQTHLFVSDANINGGLFYRISWGK